MKRLALDDENIEEKPSQDLLNASVKVLEVRKNAVDLLDIYKTLFQHLNEVYNEYPNLYQELQRVVQLPTNEDAEHVVRFYKDLLQELELLKDSENLKKVMEGNSLDIPISENDDEE